MNYLEFIKNSEGFKKLSIENQKKVIMFEIKEAIRKHTMTAHSLSPRQALLVYDALLGKDENDDEFNLSLFNQIKSIMEVMQEEEITYITIRNKNLREMLFQESSPLEEMKQHDNQLKKEQLKQLKKILIQMINHPEIIELFTELAEELVDDKLVQDSYSKVRKK